MNHDGTQKTTYQQIKDKVLSYDQLKARSLIDQDIKRLGGWKKSRVLPGFWVVLGYRLSHALYKNGFNLIGKILQGIICILTGCNISRKAIIGPGFSIYHPRDIFVGPHVYIGKNCLIGSRCFISSNLHPSDPEDYPAIDDYLIMSIGAVVVGGIYIDKKVRIAPNAVVLKSVSENHSVMPPSCRSIPSENWHKS